MHQQIPPICSTRDKPTGPIAGHEPRAVRVAALLNTVPTLGALVLFVAMSAPKIPPLQGD